MTFLTFFNTIPHNENIIISAYFPNTCTKIHFKRTNIVKHDSYTEQSYQKGLPSDE